MVIQSKKAWIGLIWLTATMTLVAGLPHNTCRCPGGQVKPFCLGSAPGDRGCCCGGSCCSSIGEAGRDSSRGQSKARPCCSGGACTDVDESGAVHAHLMGVPCCVKSPGAQQVVVLNGSKKAVGEDLDLDEGLSSRMPSFRCLVGLAPGYAHRSDDQTPPPAELLSLLQRLLL